MKTTILVSCLVIIIVLIADAYRENIGNEWRRYQLTYKRELLSTAQNPAERKRAEEYPIMMRQLVLPELDRVDRCVICHVAIEDKRMTHLSNPLKPHPGEYLEDHDLERIGCTVCHDGQGRAITFNDAIAHGHDKYWEKPALFKPFIEANCGRCHRQTTGETPHYDRGKELFASLRCDTCHKVNGKGGILGPDLSSIGDASFHVKAPIERNRGRLLEKFDQNVNLAYLYESITEPRAQPTDSIMADYKLSEEDSIALVIYLKSLSTDRLSKNVIPFPGDVPTALTTNDAKPTAAVSPVTDIIPAASSPFSAAIDDSIGKQMAQQEGLPNRIEVSSDASTAQPIPGDSLKTETQAVTELPFSAEGKNVFYQKCIACHTVGGGRRVGPDLAEVTKRRESGWLKSFIQFPSKMFAARDPLAMELLGEYVTPMIDLGLSSLQVDAVIAYLGNPVDPSSTAAGSTGEKAGVVIDDLPPTRQSDLLRATEMFQGNLPLFRGGPPCNSCHDIRRDGIIAGGQFAKELTSAYSRLGSVGLKALLENPPFPAMKQAYAKAALTEDEITSLSFLLRDVWQQQAVQIDVPYTMGMIGGGFIGASVLLILCLLIWNRRKKSFVNQDIYDRQARSE